MDLHKHQLFAVKYIPPSYQQSFSFPDPVIKYMTDNPLSSNIYQKLIKSCKYFFHQNPVLVLEWLYYIKGWKGSDSINKNNHPINCSDLTFKVWVINVFQISVPIKQENIASLMIRQFYRSNIKHLELKNQNISYNEFLFISPTVETCTFEKVTVYYSNNAVYYSNNDVVEFEKIVEGLCQLKKFN